ncbi:unnamed protein product [Symbiodinium sp. CCMP2592]|nr:unnamed protein product [Symbiodinium sp. CCMP2592]
MQAYIFRHATLHKKLKEVGIALPDEDSDSGHNFLFQDLDESVNMVLRLESFQDRVDFAYAMATLGDIVFVRVRNQAGDTLQARGWLLSSSLRGHCRQRGCRNQHDEGRPTAGWLPPDSLDF